MSRGFPSGFAAGNVVRVARIGKTGGFRLLGCFAVWVAGKRYGDWVGGQRGGDVWRNCPLFPYLFYPPPISLPFSPSYEGQLRHTSPRYWPSNRIANRLAGPPNRKTTCRYIPPASGDPTFPEAIFHTQIRQTDTTPSQEWHRLPDSVKTSKVDKFWSCAFHQVL